MFIPIEDTTPPVPEVELCQNEKPKDTTPLVPEIKLSQKIETVLLDKKLEEDIPLTETKLETKPIEDSKPIEETKSVIKETFQKVPLRESVWRKLYNKIKKIWSRK